MKSMLCAGVLAVCLAGAAVWADAKKDADKSPTTKPVAVNKFCAVQTENPVDDRVTIQFEGKTIGFCCEDCIKDFKANPDKYLDKMK